MAMEMMTYCVFIDVLGYKALVNDPSKSVAEKVNSLNSIYSNLATALIIHINEINDSIHDKIYIKSFSDCFYLESKNLKALLYTCSRIFNDTFGFYANITDTAEYTPLIRGGLVKDWVVHFNDLSSMVSHTEGTNPVGLGVARAYSTAEKSKLSGMRLLISKEVIDDLELKQCSRNGFNCFSIEFRNHFPIYLFFDKIEKNENNEPIEFFELIWPEQAMAECTFEYIEQLKKMRSFFPEEHIRHYQKTAEIILKGLLLTDCKQRANYANNEAKSFLESIIRSTPQNI